MAFSVPDALGVLLAGISVLEMAFRIFWCIVLLSLLCQCCAIIQYDVDIESAIAGWALCRNKCYSSKSK